MDHASMKYHVVTDELVLFNDEYYVCILRVPLDAYGSEKRFELFNLLYAFSHEDLEMEIDVSEEARGIWYLQLLVPYVLTLSDAAIKRMSRGSEALNQYMCEQKLKLEPELLRGKEIYDYLKRYNPGLE